MNEHAQRAVAEQLESRRLMDGSAVLADGVLEVTGTDRKDAIVIAVDAETGELDVRVNRESFAFEASQVKTIDVSAGAGNDKVLVDERKGKLYAPMTVDAGAGNDTVVGGSGDDVLVGGAGKDKLTGGAGNDQLDGGDGNDALTGGDDDDLIVAGAGKDKLAGGTGDDNLDGGDGKDAVTTGAGSDTFALDASGKSEIKDRKSADRDGDGSYQVVDPENLSDELRELHEEAIPGSIVARVEVDGNLVTIFYRFGTDPVVYKTRLDVTDGAVELVDRQISPNEIRPAARAAFESRYPGTQVLSVFQHAGAMDDVRYRDADGSVHTVTTNDLIWTVDDEMEDADNDGIGDHFGDPAYADDHE